MVVAIQLIRNGRLNGEFRFRSTILGCVLACTVADLARILDNRYLMRLAAISQTRFKLVEVDFFGALLTLVVFNLPRTLLLMLNSFYTAKI